jgi:stress response protein YsnF
MEEDAPPEVTLSEEQLEPRVLPRPYERVRVVREIVTEEVEVRVTVRREVLRVEREALEPPGVLTPEEAAGVPAPSELTPAQRELTLHVEVPVVATRVVPYERVRLARDVVDEEVELRADLRREEAEVEREDSSR